MPTVITSLEALTHADAKPGILGTDAHVILFLFITNHKFYTSTYTSNCT